MFWLGWSVWFAINAKEGYCWYLIETSWLEGEVTDHYKREKILKKEKVTSKREGTSEGTKREIFLFGIVLLFWPSLIECFDLVNQFDLVVDQFGLPSMPKREIVDIWLKQAHLFTKKGDCWMSFNHCFFIDVKLALYR